MVDLSTIDGTFIFSVSISTSDVDATGNCMELNLYTRCACAFQIPHMISLINSFKMNFEMHFIPFSAGLDYTATIDTLVFSNGGERQCFRVPIIPDFLDEPNEEFQITFSRVGTPTQGTFVGMTSVTIING